MERTMVIGNLCNNPIEGRWIGMANFCPWCGAKMDGGVDNG